MSPKEPVYTRLGPNYSTQLLAVERYISCHTRWEKTPSLIQEVTECGELEIRDGGWGSTPAPGW